MADRIVMQPKDDQGREIIRFFAERTGLQPTEQDGAHHFDVREHHDLKVKGTLDAVDPAWSDHVALGDPGSVPTPEQE